MTYVRRDPSITSWRAVPGYPHYTVSDTGVLLSRAPRRKSVGAMVPQLRANGYLRTKLCRDGRVLSVPLHRVVAWAFLGEAPEGRPFVNHLNGVKTDNRAENLEWVSHAENCRHSATVLRKQRGERNPGAVLRARDVLAIRERLARREGFAAIARDYRVTYQTIGHIHRGRTWSHL